MPAHVDPPTLLEQTLLEQLGQRLARARQARKRPAAAWASALGISRNTLRAAERGDASVTIGTYLRILAALGVAGDLALLAADTEGATDVVSRRHATLEAEVTAGTRDARSLVAVPRELARHADVTFPDEPFGTAQPW